MHAFRIPELPVDERAVEPVYKRDRQNIRSISSWISGGDKKKPRAVLQLPQPNRGRHENYQQDPGEVEEQTRQHLQQQVQLCPPAPFLQGDEPVDTREAPLDNNPEGDLLLLPPIL